MSSSEKPYVWPAEILIDVGGQHHVLGTRPHRGSPHDPFTWEEGCERFRRYTSSVLDTERAASVIDAVGALEQATDMAAVGRLVART